MSPLQLFLFGPPRIERDGKPVESGLRKADALLIYLAVTRQFHSRDALAALFWPEDNQSTARANLRRALHRLSTALGKQTLLVQAETVGLDPLAAVQIDSEFFQHQIDAYAAAATSAPVLNEAALAAFLAAAELYRDEFLAGFTLLDSPAFDDWQYFQRESFRQSFAGLLDRLVKHYQSGRHFDQSIPFARRRLTLDPLHEPAHCQLMELYAQAGNQAAALRQFAECERILQTDLDVPPAAETRALYEAIRSKQFPIREQTTRPESAAASSAQEMISRPHVQVLPTAPRHNLLAQPTPFVGREQELIDIEKRLRDPACRLLTLTGPGGAGKTRLAIRAAQRLLEAPLQTGLCSDGLFFVSLAPLQTPAEIAPAVVSALDLTLYQDRALKEQLLAYLADKQILLILDNFEHLLDGSVLVSEILTVAPTVKIVTTSREALNLAEEWFHPIAGLSFPQSQESAVLPLQAYGAVRLFEQCAQRAQVGFSLEKEAEQVVRICRLVDGMPLAIELAASWLRTVTAAFVADEIERSLDILTTQQRNVPERHRSMRAVLEQSWQMLSSTERQVLMRLSICRGGFGNEAATRIAAASLPTLALLVEKSLLRTMANNRYQMHELIRQFAEAHLQATAADEPATRQRHTAYYLAFLVARGPGMFKDDAQRPTAELSEELENIRMAWRWAVAQNDVVAAERAVASFGHILWILGRVQEADELFAEAIGHFEAQPAQSAQPQREGLLHRLHHLRASFNYFLGNFTLAQTEFEICLRQAQATGNQIDIASANNTLGAIAGFQGRFSRANDHLQQAFAIYRSHADDNGSADVQQELARISLAKGDFAEGIRWATASLADSQRIGRQDFIAYALITIGWGHFCQGDYAASRQSYQDGLDYFESIGHRFGVALSLGGLGLVVCAGEGALDRAQDLIERSLLVCRQVGHRLQVSHRLATLAQIANDRQRYAAAQHWAREGIALARQVGSPNFEAQNLCCLAEAAYRTGDLANSRAYLISALELGAAGPLLPRISLALFHAASLLLQEDTLAGGSRPHDPDKLKTAWQWLTVVADSPATWQVWRERATHLRDRCAASLSAEVLLAAGNQPFTWQDAVTQVAQRFSS